LRRSLLIGISIRKAGTQEKQMDLLLATRNAHKARELRELLGADFQLRDLSAFPNIALAEETGNTFAENAALKAISASQDRQLEHALVIADDSGLEVDALGGAPGIYSARYAGENASDAANIEKLLGQLRSGSNRSARFRCVIAVACAGKLLTIVEGAVEGTIVDPPRGNAGFGYDPVFQPVGFDKTFAEMAPELKNRISHRAKAAGALREELRAISD
jgi:XTP/dITP diphosphohydrolase